MGRLIGHGALGMLINCKMLTCLGLCFIHSNLFAAIEKSEQVFESLSNQFTAKNATNDQQFGEFFLLVIAGAVLIFVLWIAYQFFLFRKKNCSPDTAWGLYKKLCQVHSLNWTERHIIRKVCRLNGLEDPLPLFVEPNYFKEVLKDETMYRDHATVQGLLDKLFGSDQTLPEQLTETGDLLKGPGTRDQGPGTSGQSSVVSGQYPKNTDHSPLITDHSSLTPNPSTPLAEPHEEVLAFHGTEKQSSIASKVLLNPIPGRTAFTSLVEPVTRLSSEIAAVSIQHNLADGRGMNERTFDGLGEQQKIHTESQSPLFPKANVPSPGEMLTGDSRKTNRHSPVLSTPQYLRTHKKTSSGQRLGDSRSNHVTTPPTSGNAFALDDVARLETIVMGR